MTWENFYHYINFKLSCKSGVAPLTNSKGTYLFENRSKADLLNDYFASVCVSDNRIMPRMKPVLIVDKLSNICFSPDRLFDIMRKLKNSLAAGPGGFPPIFFKTLASCLADPLCMLFEYIFKCETVSNIWKHAYVTPIFKKGKSCLLENYRPTSLPSVVCKIFEGVIKLDLANYLAMNGLITSD